jgi:hypothetical protein
VRLEDVVRELEVSLQALKEECAMLRDQRALDDEALARAWDESRDMERAAVVAWLRREIAKCGCDDDTAACIERGEHRRKDGA